MMTRPRRTLDAQTCIACHERPRRVDRHTRICAECVRHAVASFAIDFPRDQIKSDKT